MKPKKSKKANLEKFRTIFFQVGMILTLSAIFVAFEWKSSADIEQLTNDRIVWTDFEELPPVIRPEKEKALKPPLPIESFTIEDDDVIIEDEPDFIDTDVDWNDPVPDFVIEDEPEVFDEPVLVAQFMPTFQGKDGSYFRNYISERVKFPEDAINNLISGTVYVSFVIDKDGAVTNVEVLRGVHDVIDNAVVKIIKNSPRWEPGMNDGKYVRVKYAIAIAFQLQ